MKVLVNGIGNIGTTLLNCLSEFKTQLGITKIYGYKNFLKPWTEIDLERLREKKIEVFYGKTDKEKFDILNSVDFIFDCSANSHGNLNKEHLYKRLEHTKGVNAQGSEKHFGIPYLYNVNNSIIQGQKFVQIVSCNTHATGYLIHAIGTQNILSADIVTVRRSEDIGNHDRLRTSLVVSRNLDPEIGTHHGIDVLDTFKTIGQDIDLQTSDITTPSQLFHSIRFSIKLKNPIDFKSILKNDKLIGTTNKFDSNTIFELGRRYGFQGRIFNPLIVIDNNLLYTDNTIIGWAFVPQEGNTILSSISSFLLQTNQENYETKMDSVISFLIRKEW